MRISIVKGKEIKANRDGDHDVRMLVCEMDDKDDVQSVELMSEAGVDYNPPDETRMLVIEVGSAYKIAIASDDGIAPTVDDGEYRIYASVGGAIVADVHCKNDGDTVINQGTGTAVEFSKLKEGFDRLKSDFNAHYHAYTSPTGPAVTSVPASDNAGTPAPSAAEVDSSESDTVRIPVHK